MIHEAGKVQNTTRPYQIFSNYSVLNLTHLSTKVVYFTLLLFYSQDLICNSPYFLLYNSYVVNLENLVLDQLC